MTQQGPQELHVSGGAAPLTVDAPPVPGAERVLSPPALEFVAELAEAFTPRLEGLLARRRHRQARLDAGERLDYLSETASTRERDWIVAPVPGDLQDRRVEITGPVDRKMIINGLNSAANVFMADFEDATAPTWWNVVRGQVNLIDAVRGTIRHEQPAQKKTYVLGPNPATLMVRPRGWHLPERHLRLSGRPVPAALVDFGIFFFHNARALVDKGAGPYFYLPKLESHLEARLWNDVFVHAQSALGLPRGTIKATVLIETLPAAFEMDEILYELREHSAGLNCGRWDYIFSAIKTQKNDPSWVIPDRGKVTMEQPFLRAYTQLLVKTCHRRGAHAIGGMAAQIPIRDDAEANRRALEKVRADKRREVNDGHDGTWVAHPGLVPIAREIFDAGMPGPHQLHVKRDDVHVGPADLLRVPEGARTDEGLRHNVRVGVQYLEAWLRGSGCVPLYHLMEDAATAEISRTQIWQWIRHGATLDDGPAVTRERFRRVLQDELEMLRRTLGASRFDGGCFGAAAALFRRLSSSDNYEEFLTLPAYDVLMSLEEEP